MSDFSVGMMPQLGGSHTFSTGRMRPNAPVNEVQFLMPGDPPMGRSALDQRLGVTPPTKSDNLLIKMSLPTATPAQLEAHARWKAARRRMLSAGEIREQERRVEEALAERRKRREQRAREAAEAEREAREEAKREWLRREHLAAMAAAAAAEQQYEPKGRALATLIQRDVAHHFGITVEELLTNRGRAEKIIRPRQVAMYLIRRHTRLSLPEIGRRFGGYDHTTILCAVRKICSLLETDIGIYNTISELELKLGKHTDKGPAPLGKSALAACKIATPPPYTLVGPTGSLTFTAHEAKLVEILHKRRGNCVGRGSIICAVWDGCEPPRSARSINVYISRVRQGHRGRPPLSSIGLKIVTIPGRGYRLVGIEATGFSLNEAAA